MRYRFLILLIFLIGTGYHPAWNQTVQIEELKAEILLKLLSRNRSIDFSRLDSVQIAIVFDNDDPRSAAEAENFRRIFLNLPNTPFKGKSLGLQRAANNRLNDLSWQEILAVMIIPGRNNRLPEILRRCADSQVLSMSTDSTLIVPGVSAAVEIDDKLQPVICFNITSLKNEGAVYDSKILQLAKYMIWE